MNFRIFSHRHKLYTNSPLWPSNQRTWSEWALLPNGEILELIDAGACGYSIINHDKRNFSIEPWTGLFDSEGRKIYLGDILEFKVFELLHEVRWLNGEFIAFNLKNPKDLPFNVRTLRHHTVIGNIHNVEYND